MRVKATVISVFVCIAFSAGCTVKPIFTKEHGLNFFPDGCTRAVKEDLRDPDSYRIDTEPVIAQKTGTTTWEWSYNAKNGYGGYGEPSRVLCYINEKGAAIIFTASEDESDILSGRNQFLSRTNPVLKKMIATEMQKRQRVAVQAFERYATESARIEADYKRQIADICEPFRGRESFEMPDGCPEYIESGYIQYPPD